MFSIFQQDNTTVVYKCQILDCPSLGNQQKTARESPSGYFLWGRLGLSRKSLVFPEHPERDAEGQEAQEPVASLEEHHQNGEEAQPKEGEGCVAAGESTADVTEHNDHSREPEDPENLGKQKKKQCRDNENPDQDHVTLYVEFFHM